MLLSISVAVVVPKTSSFCVGISNQWKLHCISGSLRSGHHRGDAESVHDGSRRTCPEGDMTWRQAL
ncbi:protein of unknown function [Streptomyces sp. KY75]|nr:protein of unknown function [Streptomyces sp. KY75]CAD5977607.1 protein of unknown function [Streptomyces sp. KY70]